MTTTSPTDLAGKPSLDRRGFLAVSAAARRASAMSLTARMIPSAAAVEKVSTPDTRFHFCGTVSGGDEVVSLAIWRWVHEGTPCGVAFYVPNSRLVEISRLPVTAA